MTCTRSAHPSACLLASLLIIPFASFAQQTNPVERLKAQYETHRQKIDAEALAAYSNVLVAVGKQLQQKADVDGYLLLKSEQTFLVKKQALPEGEDRTNLVSKLPALDAPLSRIEADRNSKIANLLKQYIPTLQAQIKQLMAEENIDAAKAVKGEMDKATLALSTMQIQSASTPALVTPAKPTPPSPSKVNVALASKGTKPSAVDSPEALNDGITTGYDGFRGLAHGRYPCTFGLTFPRTYNICTVRILLWDLDDRSYQYKVEGSIDGDEWTLLADRSKGEWRGWQAITFDPRPMKQLRITGLHNTANAGFHIVEIEAYEATKPK